MNLLYTNKPRSASKEENRINLSLNIPRYVFFYTNKIVTIINTQFYFIETYLYLKEKWKLTLTEYNNFIYLKNKKYKNYLCKKQYIIIIKT